jgi:hypothetical protein
VKGVSVAAPKKCPDELRERAVRLHFESEAPPVIRRLVDILTDGRSGVASDAVTTDSEAS